MSAALLSRLQLRRLPHKYAVDEASGCWLWTGSKTHQGYGTIWIAATGGLARAHRVMYELHSGPIPSGYVVRHACDTPSCVNPSHLSIGTDADNMRDRDERGRGARGERVNTAVLTSREVLELVAARSAGERRAEVAQRFGVCAGTVDDIMRGKSWTHVTGFAKYERRSA